MQMVEPVLRYYKIFSYIFFLLFITIGCKQEVVEGKIIAYHASNQSGISHIYSMDVETGDVTQITNHKSQNFSPNWSPDGTKIVFETNRDGNFEIYMMNADGTAAENLTHHSANDRSAVWSPNGKWIAFTSDRDGDNEIYIMDALTRSVVQVTHNRIHEYSPTWSPDSNHLAYASSQENSKISNINMMDLDGSNKSSLVTNFGYSDQPAWSPNGKWISFISNQNRKTGEIYLYQFMGGEIIQISDGIGGYKLPRWSPDSVRLVFAKNNPGINYDNELYIVYLDGFRMEKLTKGGAFYGSPIWHP